VAAAAPVDVTGNWKAAFDFQGTSVPLVFHLAAKEGVVTGTIEGLATTPTEIHDGKVDGDTITFWFNSDYAGTTYKIVGKGKITADGISLAIGTEDGSWGTDMTATKVI
jgi:riboflavin synthase alpha subunit